MTIGASYAGNNGVMGKAALALAEKFACSVWLKGGHSSGSGCIDIIVRDRKVYTLTTPRLDVAPLTTHGTGCTLSAAFAATLALELPWKRAVCESRAFVYGSLAQSVEIGRKVSAMYPPVEDSIQFVKLAEAE